MLNSFKYCMSLGYLLNPQIGLTVLFLLLNTPAFTQSHQPFQRWIEEEKLECSYKVNVLPYVKERSSCSDQMFFHERHNLYAPIPCNSVKLFADPRSIKDNHQLTQTWLESLDPFDDKIFEEMVLTPERMHKGFDSSPIKDSEVHQALVQAIQEAKHTIFLDIFLFGGHWGTELSRQLILAARRGVQVIVMHDTENPFFFRSEIDPVWNGLVKYSQADETGNLIALRPQIHRRPTGLPPRTGRILRPLLSEIEANNSPLLQSDHSKTLIIDGFYDDAAIILGSKNLSDHSAGINFDEVLRVDGPAAAAAQFTYINDLEMAFELAQKESSLSQIAQQRLNQWLSDANAKLTQKSFLIKATEGTAKVQLAANNGDDSIRNAEHAILRLIASAEESIDFYAMGMIPFGMEFVALIADAIDRGVKVRGLLDPRTGEFSGKLFLKQLEDQGLIADKGQESFRWRRLLPVVEADKSLSQMPIAQQQHTKTIVVDNHKVLIGSVNYDMMTFASTFRELSVVVKDQELANVATERFNSIFENPNLSFTYDQAFPTEPNLKESLLFEAAQGYQNLWSLSRGRVARENMMYGCFKGEF